ncbi:MAG: CHRD domain-containing protein [Actinomycetota bacterium]
MRSIRISTVLAASAAAALVGGTAAPAIAAPTAGRPLTASLSGANEIGGGDTDGSGTARVSVNYGQSRLCFSIAVSGLAPAVAAHVHDGDAGANGPVIIALKAPGADGTSSGCVTVTRTLLKGILTDPAGYYVNVHTGEFPGGAVRGQLG